MLKFYNTLTRQKEEFKPLENNTVRMYSCGPTVYSYAHIGNFRAYIFMDNLRRTLKYFGYKINGVMNITDVGHLTSDEDTGDDKMIKAAEKEHKSVYEIAEYYTKFYLKNAKELNINLPERIVKATDHVKDMIVFVKGLVDKGLAYVVDGNVYFDVEKYGKYGVLSGINLQNQKAGARIEVNSEKRSPYDFALWIKAPENHVMKWDSPWGIGYPGWHIECSVMSSKYLGKVFDIHTGGVDHIPIHHENEIAQSCGLNGEIPAKFWMHVEFLQVDGGKMSKSLGNCYRIEELEEKEFSPLDYRYFCLNTHYRKKLNFTFEALESSKTARNRLIELLKNHKNGTNEVNDADLQKYLQNFNDAVSDDLNVSLAIGELWNMIKLPYSKKVYETALKMDEILGLDFDKIEDKESSLVEKEIFDIPEEISNLAKERWQAKQNKDYKKADEIRQVLLSRGWLIIDNKVGFTLQKA